MVLHTIGRNVEELTMDQAQTTQQIHGVSVDAGLRQARAVLAELTDFVRSTPCLCCPALLPLPAIQCERCRLLDRVGGAA
ncbi:hypothetical protein C9394_15050 [Xanthomonas vasicola pv. vasculorum]|nr:hypothetical protein CQW50_02130 [Xanthomonas vasicola pv. vasculorum]RNK65029.1 hypothetical protein C9394_15050 [Xanthomonas vasicola pv. vasculorum]